MSICSLHSPNKHWSSLPSGWRPIPQMVGFVSNQRPHPMVNDSYSAQQTNTTQRPAGKTAMLRSIHTYLATMVNGQTTTLENCQESTISGQQEKLGTANVDRTAKAYAVFPESNERQIEFVHGSVSPWYHSYHHRHHCRCLATRQCRSWIISITQNRRMQQTCAMDYIDWPPASDVAGHSARSNDF